MSGYDRSVQVIARRHRPSTFLAVSALLLVALLVAACGQAASAIVEPNDIPAAAPTSAPVTQEPAIEVTSAPEPASVSPSVTVADQAVVEDSVTIARVVSVGPGWLVVHADASGKPGPVLGLSPVSDGESLDVVVRIDRSDATQTLYAMLHGDAGVANTYEFPGPDAPVLVDGLLITPAFRVTGGLASAPAAAANPTVVTTVAAGEAQVELEDNQVRPQVLTIRVGTRVKFGNRDAQPRTIRSDTSAFTSGVLQKGEEFSYTFGQAGEYPYYSDPGGGPGGQGLSGKIVVVPASGSAPGGSATAAPTASASGASPTVAAGEAEVELEDFQFVPQVLTVKAGTRVKFSNKDRAAHTATSDTGLFDSGSLQKGQEYFYTFTVAGEYPYYCAPHGGPGGQGMSGKIIVVP